MSQPEVSLDDLFREAKRAAKQVATKKKEVPAETPLSTWVNPDNWKHFRYLLVIHKETQTALGVYSELLHVKQPNCRRLVLVDEAPAIDATEYVSGDWERAQPTLESAHRHLKTILNIALAKLDCVAAYDVPVNIHFFNGKVAGVRLEQDTTFANLPLIYSFPAGTDIFLLLSQSSIHAAQELYHGN